MKFDKLFKDFDQTLNECSIIENNTKELCGVAFMLDHVNTNDFSHKAQINARGIITQCEANIKGVEHGGYKNICIDGYIIDKYVDMVKQFLDVLPRFTKEDKLTRQATIVFEQMHCFQSIQFLIRNNEMYAMVFMRSCDFDKKFETDMCLVCSLIEALDGYLMIKGITSGPMEHNITALIGSLHRYIK